MRGDSTKRRRLLLIVLGLVAGTLLWFLANLVLNLEGAGFEGALFLFATWLPFAVLFTTTGLLVDYLTAERAAGDQRALIARMRTLLPFSGLSLLILGVTLSFACGPASCNVHPFEPYGAILSAVGLFTFLSGLAVVAAIPPGSADRS